MFVFGNNQRNLVFERSVALKLVFSRETINKSINTLLIIKDYEKD